MHKLVHAWGQDRLETDGQRQLSSLAFKFIMDATAEDQIDPSHQLWLVPHSKQITTTTKVFFSMLERLKRAVSAVALSCQNTEGPWTLPRINGRIECQEPIASDAV